MKAIYKYFFALVFTLGFNKEFSSPEDSILCNYLIMKTHEQFLSINDYKVDISVDLYMPAIRMPRSNYEVFYKQPDLVEIKSKNFGVLPKAGLFESPLENFNNLEDKSLSDFKDSKNINDVIIQGYAIFDSLKFISPNEYFKLLDTLVEVKVDTLNWVIKNVKAGIFTRNNSIPLFEISNFFEIVDSDYYMPTKSIAKYYIKDKNLSNWLNKDTEDYLDMLTNSKNNDSSPLIEGRIEIIYDNYSINKGIDDDIFK
ncbi:MAG: hypothetical protein CMG00_08280 [Candidatus Marinimicrobia bacterium]|nr:hypothetical protein [Candidatus Neomarinimicrobiota bacterium]